MGFVEQEKALFVGHNRNDNVSFRIANAEYTLRKGVEIHHSIKIAAWFSPVAENKRFEWMRNRLDLILLVCWNFDWNKDRQIVSVCSLGRSA